jgi:hypothetical protein
VYPSGCATDRRLAHGDNRDHVCFGNGCVVGDETLSSFGGRGFH